MKPALPQPDVDLPQEAGSPAFANPPRVLLHMPVDVRSVSMVVLATLASVFMLHWAKAVFIPVMVGLLFSYALSPVVDWLQSRRIPRALSSAVLVLGIVSGVVTSGYLLSDDASKLVELLPASAQKLRQALHAMPGQPDNALTTVQKAAAQIEQAAEETSQSTPLGRGIHRVRIERPKFEIRDHLWSGTVGLLAILGQMGMVALITFFLLASGDTFRRKLIIELFVNHDITRGLPAPNKRR